MNPEHFSAEDTIILFESNKIKKFRAENINDLIRSFHPEMLPSDWRYFDFILLPLPLYLKINLKEIKLDAWDFINKQIISNYLYRRMMAKI